MGLSITPLQQGLIGLLTVCLPCMRIPMTRRTIYIFSFNRLLAARTALRLSCEDPGDFAHVDGTHSATFMSICYYAGGIPMIGDANPTDKWHNGWTAWYEGAGSSARINGSKIWDNHSRKNVPDPLPDGELVTQGGAIVRPDTNEEKRAGWTQYNISHIGGCRLIQFLTNPSTMYPGVSPEVDENIPADSIIKWYNSRGALAVRWWVFIGPGPKPDAMYFNPATNSDYSHHLTLLNEIRKFRAGDYVWYPIDDNAHGMMIVGYGPLIDWSQYATERLKALAGDSTAADVQMEVLGMDPTRGFKFGLTGTGAAVVTDYSKDFGVDDVPYVADWRTGAGASDPGKWEIFQGPRPFYATRLPVFGEVQAMHPYWLFIPAPNGGVVACDKVYAANCFSNAEIDVGVDGIPRQVVTGP